MYFLFIIVCPFVNFILSLCCLFFFDLRILITPLVYLQTSYSSDENNNVRTPDKPRNKTTISFEIKTMLDKPIPLYLSNPYLLWEQYLCRTDLLCTHKSLDVKTPSHCGRIWCFSNTLFKCLLGKKVQTDNRAQINFIAILT